MERLAIAVGLALVALAVAAVLQRRQRPAAPLRTGYALPAQVDRADFARPEAAWLVAVFTSATCSTCAGVWERAQPLESGSVAVQELEHGRDRDLHDRYRIEAVPCLVVADAAGTVRASFLGEPTRAELVDAMAEVRTGRTR